MHLGIMKNFCLAVASFLLGGCATQVSLPLIVSGETVLIQGTISEATAEEFKRLVSQGRVSRVLIASGGGHVEPSLAIASEIQQRNIDVEVVGNCFSSCANYIFPAGANKTISGLGIVAWHGNMSHLLHMHASGVKRLDAKALHEVQRIAKSENAFFKDVGIDQFICWFAKIEPYHVRNLYFLSADDMAKFGLAGVKVRPGYESTDISAHNKDGLVNLQFIKVDWESLRRPSEAR